MPLDPFFFFFDHFIWANKSRVQLALFPKPHHLLPRRYFQNTFPDLITNIFSFHVYHFQNTFKTYDFCLSLATFNLSLIHFTFFFQSLVSDRGQLLSSRSIPSNTTVFYIFAHIKPRKVPFQYLIGNCCCTQFQLKECVYPNYPHSRSHNSLAYLPESGSLSGCPSVYGWNAVLKFSRVPKAS